MLLSGPFEKFVEASPVTVMMRGIIENLFHPERLDGLFEENAVTQYTRTLPFSTVAEVKGEVVFNVNPSVGASLQERVDSLPVSTRAFYQKLNGVEPEVADVLVRDSVRQLGPVICKLGLRTPLLPGYNIRILDGNHFAATEHRILETRGETAAPLPGQALTVLDPDLRLAIDVFPCEDGHAQERSLLDQVLLTVCLGDLWIADRNFCTLGYPRAAVFAFCLALMAWNGMSVIHAALRSVHGEETVEENLSSYYLSLEISQVYHGMLIAIPPKEWEIFGNLTTAQLASQLKQLAGRVSLKKLQKHPRSPKRPQPKRKYSGNGQHVATAKLLARRNQ